MRKLDLSRYVIGVDGLDELKAKLSRALENEDEDALFNVASELSKAALYDVKSSLIEVLFHPELNLPSAAVLERDETANKIFHSNNSVLLEEQEWINLRNAVQAISGFTRRDSQFIRRILNAPKVEVGAIETKE